MIQDVLGRVSAGVDLAMGEMTETIDGIMRGEWTEQQIMLLLNALRVKGETIDEIAGAAVAMRRHMTPLHTKRVNVIDTCGTGGVGSETFNISTAAAIVAAAAGVPVAKHGNRSVTSKSGSADVLAQLGVKIDASLATVERCLNDLGICFCFAPQFHPAMRHVASSRKKLGVRTIFNLLGPLCNPAAASRQLLGVGAVSMRDKISGALARLNTTRAVVVTGEDGLGEVSLAAATQVETIEGTSRRRETWRPEDFAVSSADSGALRVDGPAASAARIHEILAGTQGAPRDVTILNAAAALWTAGISAQLPECARQAATAIDTGAARQLLRRLVEISQQG